MSEPFPPHCPTCAVRLQRNEAVMSWWCLLCPYVVTDLQLQQGIIR